MISASVVVAAIQIFNGTGKYIMSDFETEDIAKKRAIQRAREDAQDKAGVYLTSFSKTENARLTADEISAVTNNIIDISDVEVQSEPFEVNGETGVIWTVTLKATIDPDGIFDFIKRDDKDKVTIVQQNKDLQDAIAKNDELSASLTEQYNRATSQAERDRIREQMKKTDCDFLANQKNKDGLKLYYAKDYDGAIKLFDEALELKPDYAEVYDNRGTCYADLGQHERAIEDFDKAIALNPNFLVYNNRGCSYFNLEQYEQATQDLDKAIQLMPDFAASYIVRGCSYFKLEQYERAIRDFDKVLELNPGHTTVYALRGYCHQYLGDEAKAQADFAKAKELGYNG